MPSWTIHLAIVNKVCKEVNVKNTNIFTFANIMPDIFEGHNTPNTSRVVKDYSTHYPYHTCINGMEIDLPDIKKFKKEYKAHFDNPVILGYYTHLLTDYFWNKLTYESRNIYNNKKELIAIKTTNGTIKPCKYEEARIAKVSDFHEFEKYLLSNKEIIMPYYQEDIIKKSKEIKEIYVEKEELQNALNYLEQTKKEIENSKKGEYQIYSEDEMIKYYKESLEFILDKLNVKKSDFK